MEERRQSVRVRVDGTLATLPSSVDVQVLDINVAGVLLRSLRSLDPGSRACLRLNLWGAPFSADVEIRRVSPVLEGARERAAYDIGAAFVAITPEHRQLIERFASQ